MLGWEVERCREVTMDEDLKKQLKITGVMILIGIAILSFISIINDKPVNVDTVSSYLPEEVRSIQAPQIKWNDVALTDSTQFNNSTNTCTASRYGMEINITPCIAYDADSKQITQDVTFKWNGALSRNITWIFVYDDQLSSGSIEALMNDSFKFGVWDNAYISNYLVTGVVSYVNLTQKPEKCDLGNLNNTQYYLVTRQNVSGQYNQTVCFTERTLINATSFRISGNADVLKNKSEYRLHYVDVTDRVEYLGKGLLQDNRSYYKVEEVLFNPNQTIKTKWIYTPKNSAKVGKWHILGFDSSTGLIQSVINEQYIYIDPWWSSSWTYKRPIQINGTIPQNYTIRLSIPKTVAMSSNCSDLRFLDNSESTELPHKLISCNTTTVIEDVQIDSNGTYYLYYGNAIAPSTSKMRGTYQCGDDFDDYTGAPANISTVNSYGLDVKASGELNATIGGGGATGAWKCNNVLNFQNYTIYQRTKTMLNGVGTEFKANNADDGYDLDVNMGSHFYHMYIGTTWGGAESGNFNSNPYTHAGAVNTYYNFTIIANGSTNIVRVEDLGSNNIWSYNSTTYLWNNVSFMGLVTSFDGGKAITTDWFYVLPSQSDYSMRYSVGAESNIENLQITSFYPLNLHKTNNRSITFNATFLPTEKNITNWTFYVYNLDNSLNASFNGTENTNTTITRGVMVNFTADGNYTWSVTVCGMGTTTLCVAESNRSFEINTVAPVFTAVNITNITTISLPINWTFNISSSDASLQACSYNTTNHATSNYSCNTAQVLTFTTGGTKTLWVWANDTFGNYNFTSYTFRIYDFNVTQYENADPIAEGSESIISLKINSTSFPIGDARANITWNGTSYNYSTKTVMDANTIRFDYIFPVTAGLGNSTGKPYLYNWTYNTTQLAERTTSTTTQTIISFGFDDCTTYTTEIMNISLKDEEQKTYINDNNGTATNLEVDIIAKSLSNASINWTFAKEWFNITSARVCVPSGSLNNTNFSIQMTMGFNANGYVQEFYYLDNGTLATGHPFNSMTPRNITLYDLLAGDSTTFLFEFQNEDGLEIDDAIVHVFRYYIGDGVYREVERAKQDDVGQTHVHLVEEDVIYYFVITQYGNVIYTSSTYNAKCLSEPCSITLSAQNTFIPFPTDWQSVYGSNFQVGTNKTSRTVSVNYVNDGSKTVNLSVYRYKNGQVEFVNTTQGTASSGTLTLTVPASYGNETFISAVYINNVLAKSNWIDFNANARDIFGNFGAVMGGLLVLTLILMTVSEGIVLVVVSVVAVIFIAVLKIADFTLYSIVGLICLAGVIVWKLISRRGK